jgi:hypothetical protein
LALDLRRPPRRPAAAANSRGPKVRSISPGTYTSTSTERLISFADAARDLKAPEFLAAIWHTFSEAKMLGDVATRRPALCRQLLFLR